MDYSGTSSRESGTAPEPASTKKMGAPQNLAELIAVVGHDEATPRLRRTQLKCDIVRFCQLAKKLPVEVPADAQIVLKIMKSLDGRKKFTRRGKEMSHKTWLCMQYGVWVAFDIADIPRPVLRQAEALSPEWAEPHDALKAGEERKEPFFVKARKQFSPLMHHCSSRGIPPSGLNDAALEGYFVVLCNRHGRRRALSILRRTARMSNQAIDLVPGWPKIVLRVPEADKYESPPWSAYPPELLAKIEDYFASRTEEKTLEACIEDTAPEWEYDVADGLPPRGHNSRRERRDGRILRPSSADKDRSYFRIHCGALVELGVPRHEMANLMIVLDRPWVARSLILIKTRIGSKKQRNSHLRGIANALVGLAEWAVEQGLVPPHWPDAIRKMRNLARPDYSNLTEKNLRFVNQLEDETFRQTLQCLPDILIEECEADEASRRPRHTALERARLFETAAIVELALATGLRVNNLAALDLEEHFDTTMGGETSIIIPGEQMKNGGPANIPLSDETMKILKAFCSRYRGHLTDGPSTKLFPGRSNGHIGTGTIGRRLFLTAQRHLSCKMTPHQFRHAIAWLIDDSEPDAPGLAAKVLGQRSQGAIKHYMVRRRRGAHRRYQEIRDANRRAIATKKGNNDVL